MNCISNVIRSLTLAGAVACLFVAQPAMGDWSIAGGHGKSDKLESSNTVNSDGESTDQVEGSEERSNVVGVQYSDKKVDGNTTTENKGEFGFNWGKEDKGSLSETTKDGKTGELEDKLESEDKASIKVDGSHKVEENLAHGEVDNGKWGKGSADVTTEIGTEGSLEVGKDKISVDGKIGGNVKGRAEYEMESEKFGNENNNISVGGKVYTEAEIGAEIAGNLKIDKDGATLHAGGEIGASLSVGGDVSLKGELAGVPVNVTLEGKASVGAKGKAGVDFEFKDGKLKITAEASVVFGVGAEGKVTIDVGVGELIQLVKTGFIDKLFGGKDGKAENTDADGTSPFDSQPESGTGDSSGKKEHFHGLKPIKVFD